jgi:rhamnulokinase
MPRAKPVHCAAVDLGATSGRVIVGTWTGRRLGLTEVHRFANRFTTVGGHDYWDVPGLWAEIVTGLRAARRRFPRLASVGVDTWGVDHVLLNDRGRIVFPTHAYRDARTQRGLQRLAHTRAALERIYAATGIPNVFYNTSLQLGETVASCPAVTDLATRCLCLPDYFNFLLSGRAENEISIASTTQLLDVHGRDWSRAALAHFHVPAGWFTRPILAGTVLGPVRGLPELAGVKVIAAPGHDTACAYDAMPADPGGEDLYISSGTWSLVGFESDRPVLGPGALAARISNERTGDGRYRPLTNVIGLWLLEQTLKEFAARPRNDREWAALLRRAGACEPSGRSQAVRAQFSRSPNDPSCAGASPFALGPLLDVADPAFVNPPSMRAAIDAQLRRRRRPVPRELAGYVRLICDSLGQGHADALRAFEQLAGRKFRRILIVGGGSKNSLLGQATADASGLPVHAFTLEGTATGNIASQLIGLGAARNLAEVRGVIARQIEPVVYQPRPTVP